MCTVEGTEETMNLLVIWNRQCQIRVWSSVRNLRLRSRFSDNAFLILRHPLLVAHKLVHLNAKQTVQWHFLTKSATLYKSEVHPITGHEGPQKEQRYSYILFLSSALDGGERLTPHPGRFTPGKETRYPLYRRLGGPQGRSGRVGNSPITGIRSPDRPASCESLYRLSHRGSLSYVNLYAPCIQYIGQTTPQIMLFIYLVNKYIIYYYFFFLDFHHLRFFLHKMSRSS